MQKVQIVCGASVRNAVLVLLTLLASCVAQGDEQETILVNGDFESRSEDEAVAGWQGSVSGKSAVVVTASTAVSGAHSLRLHTTGEMRSLLLRQAIPVAFIRNGPIHFSGHIRTAGVHGSAVMVAVVNGRHGRLFVDDMRTRPARGTTNWTEYVITIPRLVKASSAYVGVLLLGEGTAWFDDLEVNVKDVGTALSSGARKYLAYALDRMEARYVDHDKVDWAALRAFALRAAAGAQTVRDTHPALSAALTRLPDRHSLFIAPGKIPAAEEDRRVASAAGAIASRFYPERIAYINVPAIRAKPGSEEAIAYIDSLHSSLRLLDARGACGWIVDLRGNTGGTMWPMLAGMGPLLGEGVLGAHVRADEERAQWWYRDGMAGVRTRKGETVRSTGSGRPKPLRSGLDVAVLLSRDTSSSGESIAIAFKGRDNTRSFGSPTAGLTSANGHVRLPDGAELVFPIAYSADRNGTLYTAAVTPDEMIPGNDVLARAREWLSSRQDCRRKELGSNHSR